MDEQLRELERAWEVSQSQEDLGKLLHARLQAGQFVCTFEIPAQPDITSYDSVLEETRTVDGVGRKEVRFWPGGRLTVSDDARTLSGRWGHEGGRVVAECDVTRGNHASDWLTRVSAELVGSALSVQLGRAGEDSFFAAERYSFVRFDSPEEG